MTLDFYNNNSKEYIQSTISVDMSNIHNIFLELIPKESNILDLGCGSGRDSKVFIEKGYKVTAVDGSKEIAKATSEFLNQKVIVSKFEKLELTERYDGVWACASLLHVDRKNIIDVLKNILSNLKTKGVLYMSFKYGNNEYVDDKGRYFNSYTEEGIYELINKIQGLIIEEIFTTIDVIPEREDIIWLNVICKSKCEKRK